jgi:hypothetical protein
MSAILVIFLLASAGLVGAMITYFAMKSAKEETVAIVEVAPVEEVKEEPVVEEVKPEPVKVVEVVEEVAAADDDEELEDPEDDREKAKRIPFAEKMLVMDEKTQSYYDELNNKFKSMRKINPRVSVKGVSYRLGRELVAKITIRGKTMKLHLALDVDKFEEKIYFQKSMADVKAYAEVPFTVKVKSDRGVKNAVKLVDALAEAKGIEYKTRYNQVDSIAQLKDVIVKNVLDENK